ncbi:NAD(+)/NADH kinase [Leptolinea tardivitalis]|uniref:NAD(+)/NADH kinase n=1 Tax=Leptolinea tardivitalis TaxID=229920 RepID=UPI0009D6A1AE|nr:NAD(+)/NADH kinase [Leptolinea tardivitalis]GAP21696.1 predicted sugar kinase [Leptolinea tardivitalis]
MDTNTPSPRRFAIVCHPGLDDASSISKAVASFLLDHGALLADSGSIYQEDLRERISVGNYDMLISLGGDGTILRAGHIAAPRDIPLLGINLGHFGFLSEVGRDNWQASLETILSGHYRLEERMMLKIEHFRGDTLLGNWQAINEVVICRGQFVRPIQLTASVNGYRTSTYVADGLIVATPTGSTAYALAAGGPILPPEMRNLLIVPVAPHLSMDRAIILPEGVKVAVQVNTSHEAVLSVDGHAPVVVIDGDRVVTSFSEHVFKMVRLKDPGYFYRNITLYMEHNPSTETIK